MTDVLWNVFWFLVGTQVGLIAWSMLRALRQNDEDTTPWEPSYLDKDVEMRLFHGQVESRSVHD